MRPLALVSTVVPLIVVVVRAVPVAAGAVELAPAQGEPEQHQRRDRQAGGGHRGGPGGGRRDLGGEGGRSRCAAAGRGGGERERGQHREGGRLDQAGGDAGGGADFREPEQPGPDRQQVAAEGGQREAGSGGGGQPAGQQCGGRPAGDGQHRQGEAERRDHLQQEQPPDGRDGPVPGQVQVKMDRRGGGQQPRTRDPQDGRGPAGRRPSGVLPRAPCRSRRPGHAVPSCHRSVLRVRLLPGPVSVAAAAGAG